MHRSTDRQHSRYAGTLCRKSNLIVCQTHQQVLPEALREAAVP